ncbi:MAG: hypothetical protein ACYTDU_03395 [Planctomycetota bacterium]|jgi:hypothetical protein
MTLRTEALEPALQFSLLKGLSYRRRLLIVALVAAAGLVLQVVFLSFWAGLPFLLAAVICSWVVGFDNKLDKRRFHHDVAWETAPFDRVATILRLDRAGQRWDFSLLDISNPTGCGIFLAGFLGAVLLVFLAAAEAGKSAAMIVGGDMVLLILGQWFSGMRSRFRQADLVIKAEHVLAVMRTMREEVEKEGELRVQLRMGGKSEQRAPSDLKLSIRYPEAPAHFLGVQAQIVLNRVQGRPYPYFYAVVLARQGHDLLAAARRVELPRGVILETKSQKDVDVAIVRQHTTRTSGYHTKPNVSCRILRTALEIARQTV